MDQLLIKAMRYQSLDNLSIVMIGLKNFKKALQSAWEMRRGVEKSSETNEKQNLESSPTAEYRPVKEYLNPINDKRTGARERSASGSMNLSG